MSCPGNCACFSLRETMLCSAKTSIMRWTCFARCWPRNPVFTIAAKRCARPNSGAHKIVVEAAHALDFPRTAALSLEVLAKNSPKDRDIAISFANSLADAGDSARAEAILANLVRSSPHDNELAQALKNISARRTMQKGGYDTLA